MMKKILTFIFLLVTIHSVIAVECTTNDDCSTKQTCPDGTTYYEIGCNNNVCEQMSFTGGTPCFNEAPDCAEEGENIYDMASKGPTSCCAGLILEPCEGICTMSIPGKCVKACASLGEKTTGTFDLTNGQTIPLDEQRLCCEGLKSTNTRCGEDDTAIFETGTPGICIACGDGVCDLNYEDVCNCPEDCEFDCAKEGEKYSQVYSGYQNQCCEGLTEWNSGMDTRKIENGKCVETDLVSGNPVGTCINCGNGVCEAIEDICNCPEDCEFDCAKEGEKYSQVYSGYQNQCCEGLTEWNSGMDTRKIENGKCVETDLVSGNPVGTCINCGNGVCEAIEDVCNCPEDCEFDYTDKRGEEELPKVCDGCVIEGKCYNIGYRKAGEYCSNNQDQEPLAQLIEGNICDNNFECKSNLCIDSECISGGFFKKVMNWFNRLFGGQ